MNIHTYRQTDRHTHFRFYLLEEDYIIHLCRLIPYADEITGDHQRGFQRNSSITDQSIIMASQRPPSKAILRAILGPA
jgi:hypothetical protein